MFEGITALTHVMYDAKRPRSALKRLIHARLRTVLTSAYRHVPYYRTAMQAAGYNPETDYQGPQDLATLPILTKQHFKNHDASHFLHQNADLSTCHVDATSGSTGIPLEVYRNPTERALQIAMWLRVLFLNGYSAFDKVMSFTSPRRLNDGRSVLQSLGLFRRHACDYRLSAEEMTETLLSYQPHVLYGNRAQLDLTALELLKRGTRPQHLKLLVGGAEIIHEAHRQRYREAFGLELVEFYGSVEMGSMAYETQAHDGLHLSEDLIYFEFLDAQNTPVAPGQKGRVVVTDLRRVTMPFIRAEVIHEAHRQRYREAFGLELTEFYGSVEMGSMAFETQAHDGLHLSEDLIYFEFLDAQNTPVAPGQKGRVVVTDLRRVTMPFIRYDQGDWVTFEQCENADGGPVRRITQIWGRDEDYVVMPDGSRRSFHAFYEILHAYPVIKQYRIIQKKPDYFQILLLAERDDFKGIHEALQCQLQKHFPATVRFELLKTDHLAPDPNGKFKRVVSELQLDTEGGTK